MKKLGIIVLTIVFLFPFSVFALDTETDTKQASVNYDVNGSYEWSVPSTFTLEETNKLSNADGSTLYKAEIPVTFSNVVLPAAQTSFVVDVTSTNNFKLTSGSSSITYFASTTSLNVSQNGTQNITLCTTSNEILKATSLGRHSDTLTFTVSYGGSSNHGSTSAICAPIE